MAIKKELFGKIEKIAKPGAVLATNTSYLDVDQIAQMTSCVPDVLGMHFFSPANVMKLLEIVRGNETATGRAGATAISVARKINKVPVVVGVCHGFVGNRMPRTRGSKPSGCCSKAHCRRMWTACYGIRIPDGPVAMGDLAGLISAALAQEQGVREEIAESLGEPGPFSDRRPAKDSAFTKAARRSPTRGRDPDRRATARMGVKRRNGPTEETIERLIYPMINEGARILDEGIATRSGDIDVMWIDGYGFPAWRGGPMYWADTMGLPIHPRPTARTRHQTGDKRHEPAALLNKLADEGGNFAEYGKAKAA